MGAFELKGSTLIEINTYLSNDLVDVTPHRVHGVERLLPSRDDPPRGWVYGIQPVSIVTVTRGAVTQPESVEKVSKDQYQSVQ